MSSGRIRLRLFASLQKWAPALPKECELPEPKSVRSVVSDLGVSEREVAILFVNGKRGGLDDMLKNGDEVNLFPLIGGG